jgi:hypothetical protein
VAKSDKRSESASGATPNDPLVEKAFAKDFDDAKQKQLLDAIGQLSPDEAAHFLAKLEVAFKKRKIQLVGYLVAMFAWLVGMLFALAYYGLASGFVGWVFLLPFAMVGLILYLFGKWADRAGRLGPDAPPPPKSP